MNRRCIKCDDHNCGVKWDAALDMMEWTCTTCGYKWMDLPADRKKSQSAGQPFVLNPAPDASPPSVPSGICGTMTVTR